MTKKTSNSGKDVCIEKVHREDAILFNKSTIFEGDALTVLRRLESKSVQCAITSPPYWGLRNYGIVEQIGLEETLPQFLHKLVSVFSEVKRVLKEDGTLWLNIGDGYTSGNRGWRAPDKKNPARAMDVRPDTPEGLKKKDLIGMPWRLAFALQEDGWYLRSDIVWHKPNAMPESVKDRPARSHEYISSYQSQNNIYIIGKRLANWPMVGDTGTERSVWSVNTKGFSGAHFATFPTDLIRPCVLASSRPGDFVLDPFFGSGTVGIVCQEEDRSYVGIELNPEYVSLASHRLQSNTDDVVRVAVA